jgi:predicted metalloprotease with PDZ domain
MHRFWNDTDFPFYFLAVTALQNNQKEIGAGGFGIKNGFVMKLGRKFGTREKYVTAHETAHTWVGIKIMLGESSFDHQWFGEGFNDYTAIINLANSQIYGEEDFLYYLNEETLKPHYESKIKGVHNDSIAAKYWTDYANYGVLPYRRGCIYAFYLDNQIRLASNGKFTLRNMLLDLYELRKEKKKDEVLTVDDFINVGAAYLDKKELAEQVARHMIEGQPIDFTNIKLIAGFKIELSNSIPKVNLAEGADLSEIYRW